MGTTKARRVDVLRAIAQLQAQARLNAGNAARLRRHGEEAAWLRLADNLELLAENIRCGESYERVRLF